MKKPLKNKCVFCGQITDFGQKCYCLDTSERINKLHDRVLDLLGEKKDERI